MGAGEDEDCSSATLFGSPLCGLFGAPAQLTNKEKRSTTLYVLTFTKTCLPWTTHQSPFSPRVCAPKH